MLHPTWAPTVRFYPCFEGPFHSPWFLIFCTKGPYPGFFTTAFVPCPFQTFWGTLEQNAHSAPTPVQPPQFDTHQDSPGFPYSPFHPLNSRAHLFLTHLLRLFFNQSLLKPSNVPRFPVPEHHHSLNRASSVRSAFLFSHNCPINAQL